MLLPVMALVLWTLFMLVWMLSTRIPAIVKTRLKLTPEIPQKDLMATLPSKVRWKAENYNHLFEQPVLFYVTGIVSHILIPENRLNLFLAWAYVGSRIIHSIWQSCWNIIRIRFMIFVVSSLILAAMVLNTLVVMLELRI